MSAIINFLKDSIYYFLTCLISSLILYVFYINKIFTNFNAELNFMDIFIVVSLINVSATPSIILHSNLRHK